MIGGRLRRAVLGVVGVAALVGAACGGDGGSGVSGREGALSGKITVFAAASLTDAFDDIAAAFEAKYPGTEVIFNYGGSPTLRVQLEQGARADLFASADLFQMGLAKERGIVAGETIFARNSLIVIVPAANQAGLTTLGDLKRDGLKLVVANEAVPVGAYTREALATMDADAALGPGFSEAVLANVVSLEANVKQVVAKVELGEADAGIVYGSDVSPSVAPNLATIEIPARLNIVAEYPIALTREVSNGALAEAFVAFLLSEEGQAVLRRFGFS